MRCLLSVGPQFLTILHNSHRHEGLDTPVTMREIIVLTITKISDHTQNGGCLNDYLRRYSSDLRRCVEAHKYQYSPLLNQHEKCINCEAPSFIETC